MPTIYRNGEQVKVVASDDFITKNRAAQDEVIVANKISKMQFNLSNRDYQELFTQYKLQQEEHKQRMAQIQKIASITTTRQQYQHHQQKNSQRRQNPVSVVVEPNSSRNNNTDKTESSNVLKHLKLMKRITGT